MLGVSGRKLRPEMRRHSNLWRPPTDVYETDDALVVRVEIAGVKESDFSIELVRRRLVVSGNRFDHSSAPKLAYQQMEILYGEFRTDVYLPLPIEENKVEAIYQDGFLSIRLPKAKVLQVPIGGAEKTTPRPTDE